MNYKEMSLWASLLVTISLLLYYIFGVHGLHNTGMLSQESMVGYLYRVVIVAVILEVVVQSIVAGVKHKEVEYGDDERDKLIELKGSKIGYWCASSAILMTIFLTSQIERVSGRLIFPELSDLLNIMHLLVIAFLLSELTRFAVKVYYYRRGF